MGEILSAEEVAGVATVAASPAFVRDDQHRRLIVDLCASHEALRRERDALERRLAPAQGHGYDNEVERQRAVIDQLTEIADGLRRERDEALAALEED